MPSTVHAYSTQPIIRETAFKCSPWMLRFLVLSMKQDEYCEYIVEKFILSKKMSQKSRLLFDALYENTKIA